MEFSSKLVKNSTDPNNGKIIHISREESLQKIGVTTDSSKNPNILNINPEG